MDKQSLPSIEKFAAYLDGNLSQDEMLQISHWATNNEDLMNLLDANEVVEETLASYGNEDLMLPKEIANMDFEIPKIENIEISNHIADSLSDNQSLYKQEDFNEVDRILDEIFGDKTFDSEEIDDIDIDIDVNTDILEIFN